MLSESRSLARHTGPVPGVNRPKLRPALLPGMLILAKESTTHSTKVLLPTWWIKLIRRRYPVSRTHKTRSWAYCGLCLHYFSWSLLPAQLFISSLGKSSTLPTSALCLVCHVQTLWPLWHLPCSLFCCHNASCHQSAFLGEWQSQDVYHARILHAACLFFIFYTSMMLYYYLLTIWSSMKDERYAKLKKYIHVFCIGYPLITATVGAVLGMYHKVELGPGCWVAIRLPWRMWW